MAKKSHIPEIEKPSSFFGTSIWSVKLT